MSTTESLMLVALGATLALIAVVLFSRGMWEAALYVMRKRRENEIPAKIIALEAERDKLRAEHASMAVTMETTIADVKRRMAEQSAEVSRHRNKMLGLTEDVLDRDKQLEARGRDIADLTNRVSELDALSIARAMAIKDLDQQLNARQDDIKRLTLSNAELLNRLESSEEHLKDIKRELDFAFAAKAIANSNIEPESDAEANLKKKLHEISSKATEVRSTQKPMFSEATSLRTQSQFDISEISATDTVAPHEAQKNVDDIVAAARSALQAKIATDSTENITSLATNRADRDRKKSAGIAAITKRLRAMQGNA